MYSYETNQVADSASKKTKTALGEKYDVSLAINTVTKFESKKQYF